MAFVDPNQVLPGNPQAQPGQPSGQAPIAAGGAGQAGVTGTKAAATPGQNVPAQPSAQLSAYLSANQPQTGQFAGNVANTVGGQINAAGSAIAPAVNSYTGQLYTAPANADVNQKVQTAPSTLSADEKAAFGTELGAADKSANPAGTFETTSPYASLSSDIQKAVEQANLWNSGNNVPNLTQALAPFESGTTTAGGKTLDALLISQSPDAYKQVQNAVAPAAALPGQLTAATAQANDALKNSIATNTATTQSAKDAAATYAANLTTYLTNAVNQATGGAKAENDRIMADLTANTPTPEDLQTLGISADQWAALSDHMAQASAGGAPITLQSYLTQAPTNSINAATLATPQNYADVAALQELLGPGNAPVTPINATTANEAGTAPTSFNTFDYKGADTQAQANTLISAAKGIEAQEKSAEAQYPVNHFGGQSPEQFNSYIQGLNNQLSSINAQLQKLGDSGTFLLDNGVPWTPQSTGINTGIWPLDPFLNATNWFGFAEGGEVPRPRNLVGYLGA